MKPTTAVYVRISSKSQHTKSQEPDLRRYVECHGEDARWYRDTFTGKSMDRKGWNRLMEDVRAGSVSKIVVWRLDRLGRTAKG
jgi:DNA invertase Pin-like site-specific DNA recombinase